MSIMGALAKLPRISEAEWLEAKERTDAEWTRVKLPPGYMEFPIPTSNPAHGCRAVRHGKASILFSAGRETGTWWLHVSMAHPEKLPSYIEITELKRIFIGRDRQALQIFPAESEHVNIHGRALHLWACLEEGGDGLPRFGQHGTI